MGLNIPLSFEVSNNGLLGEVLRVGVNPAELLKSIDSNRNYQFDLILTKKKSNSLKTKPYRIWFGFELL